jgi:glycosyltransferase 2 family protein
MRWRLTAVLVFTGLCMGWVLWGISWQESVRALADFKWVYLMGLLGLFVLTSFIRTWRFQWLLNHPVSYGALYSIQSVSFLAINLLPLRLGELVRPYLLAEKTGCPVGTAMAAVVMERLLDIVALLCLYLWISWTVELPAPLMVNGVDLLSLGARTVTVGAVLGIVFLLVGGVYGRAVIRLLDRICEHWQVSFWLRVRPLVETFFEAVFGLLRHPMRSLGAVVCTALTWVGTVAGVWILFFGFEEVPGSLDLAVFSWGGCVTAMTLFPTPGFLGPFEVAGMEALGMFGVDRDIGRVYALVLHGVIFGFTVITGVACLLWEGWSLAQLVRSSRTLGENT